MTECEKREKSIEKIAKVFCGSIMPCNECLKADNITCDAICLATRVYDHYILPTEEEVRKETAKEILHRVKLFLDEQTKTVKHLSRIKSSAAIPQSCVECYEGSQDNRLDELNRIAKEFGVEVEE